MARSEVGVEQGRLGRSGSNESLFRELSIVANAEPEVVARCIGSRAKADRSEIHRILGHLPAIREHHGLRRHVFQPSEDLEASGPVRAVHVPRPSSVASHESPLVDVAPLAPGPRRLPVLCVGTPRAGTPRGTPRTTWPRAATPGEVTPRAATPRAVTPRTCPIPAQARALTPRVATPRAVTPRATASPKIGSGGDHGVAVGMNAHQERLAELGIDPKGMTANEILKMFYARGDSTSYGMMNKDVGFNMQNRPKTPRSLRSMLTSQAHQEVRQARDMPVAMIHDCLDKWEIDSLADVCRSLHYYEDQMRGPVSEYTRGFAQTVFGQIDRKKFIRKPV